MSCNATKGQSGLFQSYMEDAIAADDYERVRTLLTSIDRSRCTYMYNSTVVTMKDVEIRASDPRRLVNDAARAGSYNVVKGFLEGYYTEPADANDEGAHIVMTANTLTEADTPMIPPGWRPAHRARPLPTHKTLCEALRADDENEDGDDGEETKEAPASLRILRLIHAYEPRLFHTAFLNPRSSSDMITPKTTILNLAVQDGRLRTVKWLLDTVGATPTTQTLTLALTDEPRTTANSSSSKSSKSSTPLRLLKLLHAASPDLLSTPIPMVPSTTDPSKPSSRAAGRAATPVTTDVLALAVLGHHADIVRWLLRLHVIDVNRSSYAGVFTTSWLTAGLVARADFDADDENDDDENHDENDDYTGDGLGVLFDRDIASALLDHGADFGPEADAVLELCGMSKADWEEFRRKRRAVGRAKRLREEKNDRRMNWDRWLAGADMLHRYGKGYNADEI